MTFRYWGGMQGKVPDYPLLLRGLVNAAANMGNIVGQLSFGYLGDIYGRRFVYGNELIIGIFGIVMCIALPNSISTAHLKMAWIFCWRFVLGIGIGGDYPISAAITAERTHLKRRGRLLGWIFSNQGWVSTFSGHSIEGVRATFKLYTILNLRSGQPHRLNNNPYPPRLLLKSPRQRK